jgi:hypothetical protein
VFQGIKEGMASIMLMEQVLPQSSCPRNGIDEIPLPGLSYSGSIDPHDELVHQEQNHSRKVLFLLICHFFCVSSHFYVPLLYFLTRKNGEGIRRCDPFLSEVTVS